ncbi:MAG TPA: type II toxin-antitoxin system VapC family toxin [Gemmatimonadota bacterium]|nr:type II toxin-antitoxin system VapC family toxin [Gemmatimonadota bacterium]
MVIDTSAITAILFDEDEAERMEIAIEEDPVRLLSAASLLEASIVIETRYGEPGGRELDLLLHRAQIEIASVDAALTDVARGAYRKWGRRRSPAGLNFGDCFSYALSKTSGEPLLFKGEDLARTDVARVEY